MAANRLTFYGRRKSRRLALLLFQIHRLTKKSAVLSSDFVVANQRRDRLPLRRGPFDNWLSFEFL